MEITLHCFYQNIIVFLLVDPNIIIGQNLFVVTSDFIPADKTKKQTNSVLVNDIA